MRDYTFKLDCSADTRKVTKHWQHCVGSCHAALAHRFDYMEQLEFVTRELGIKSVRFHGLFNDDMSVAVRTTDLIGGKNKNASRVYDFYQISVIYDRLLKIGVKPLVELGFMPTALASGKKTIFTYRGNVTPPKIMSEWTRMISEFITFLIGRYGIEEVMTWEFEVWNEPDLNCFWAGSLNDYFNLYKDTCRAIKSVDSRIRVGGPSTTYSKHLTEFLNYCADTDTPVDFVTTHQYPSDALGHNLDNKRLTKLLLDRSREIKKSLIGIMQPIFYNEDSMKHWKKGEMHRNCVGARAEVGDLPLYYTEWNIDSNCVASIHDRIETSAFVVKNCLDNQGVIDGSSYWTFSDIFEEMFFFPEPFTGAFGMLNIHGIPKPSFWAFKLLGKLSDERYDTPITDDCVEFSAFKSSDGGAQLMVYAQEYIDKNECFDVSFELDNIKKIRSVTAYRVNKTSGNAVAVWQELNSPSTLKPSEVEYIKANSKPLEESLSYKQSDNKVEIKLNITTNEIIYVEVK